MSRLAAPHELSVEASRVDWPAMMSPAPDPAPRILMTPVLLISTLAPIPVACVSTLPASLSDESDWKDTYPASRGSSCGLESSRLTALSPRNLLAE